MDASPTYLAPGQRYAQPGTSGWRLDQQVTIARLDRDPFGFTHVVFRGADGREVTAYAIQVEAAIADGTLTPVVGAGAFARC